jgi:hypothetical protein
MTTKETPRPGWREQMTITVPEYAQIVGVGRNTAYESVRAGEVAPSRCVGASWSVYRPSCASSASPPRNEWCRTPLVGRSAF